MRRLPTRDWIDWFGSRHGLVEVTSPALARPARHRLGSASYAPFDDLIELVFVGVGGREWRLLLDRPRSVEVEEEGAGAWCVEIHSRSVDVVLRSAARVPAAHGASVG